MTDLVNARDYPREQYTHYWEIFIDDHDFSWTVNYWPYDAGNTETAMVMGRSDTKAAARLDAQSNVLGAMPKYRKHGR